MRFTAPIAALVLAGIAWLACWQEVQLVRLRRQVQSPVASTTLPPPPAVVQNKPFRARPPARAAVSQLDQLRALLIDREEAIADAREAAGQYGIAEGSPDMDRAILQATKDFDRAIIQLAGPAAADQLTVNAPPSIPTAAVPSDVQAAPIPAVIMIPAQLPPAAAPAPSYAETYPPTTNIYVTNVTAPEPAYADAAADAAPASPYVEPVLAGGAGYTIGTPVQPKLTGAQKLKYFAASAGIPMTPSPLGAVVATSPLLLMQQHASAASGR